MQSLITWVRNIDIRKVAGVLGILTLVEMGIVNGDIPLAGALPAAWIPGIVAWCKIFIFINNALLVGHAGTAISWTMPRPAVKAVVAAFLIGSLALLSTSFGAHAQNRHPVLTGHPVEDIQNALANGGKGTAANQNTEAALLQPFNDLANYIAGDINEAERLSVSVSNLQDGNGLACLNIMQSVGLLYKQHPPAITFHAASDWEGLRLLSAALKKVCAAPSCQQVFSDIKNIVTTASPVPLTAVPGVSAADPLTLCAKIADVPMVTPDPTQLKAAQSIQPANAPTPTPAAPGGPAVTAPQ